MLQVFVQNTKQRETADEECRKNTCILCIRAFVMIINHEIDHCKELLIADVTGIRARRHGAHMHIMYSCIRNDYKSRN